MNIDHGNYYGKENAKISTTGVDLSIDSVTGEYNNFVLYYNNDPSKTLNCTISAPTKIGDTKYQIRISGCDGDYTINSIGAILYFNIRSSFSNAIS